MKNFPENKFGNWVRSFRENKNIGLRELARKIDVSPTYLSRIEQGKEEAPSTEKICRIAEVLEIDKDQLLKRANKVVAYYTENLKNEEKFPELLQQIAKSADRTETIDNLIDWLKTDAIVWKKYKE